MNKVEIIKKYIKDMSGYNHRKAINTFNELNSEHLKNCNLLARKKRKLAEIQKSGKVGWRLQNDIADLEEKLRIEGFDVSKALIDQHRVGADKVKARRTTANFAVPTIGVGTGAVYIRRKKQIEKQASVNPLYMTKKLGTRFGKFGASGRSGVGGVGIGMPGASGTGIPPQSASNLQRLLNTSSKPVKIEGSLSSSRAAKLNGVNTNVTKL